METKKLKCIIKASHIEIYNEKVYDLLGSERREITIRERKDGKGAALLTFTESMTREKKSHVYKYIMHIHIVRENEEVMKMQIDWLEDLYPKEQ